VLSGYGQACVEFDDQASAKGLGRLVKRALGELTERGAKGLLREQKMVY
jgi:hypothetical protein